MAWPMDPFRSTPFSSQSGSQTLHPCRTASCANPNSVVSSCANLPLGAVRPAPGDWIERLSSNLGDPRLSTTPDCHFPLRRPTLGVVRVPHGLV